MIDFNFCIRNPFSNTWRVLFNRSGQVFKNKAWEINTYRSTSIVSFEFRYCIRSDHAGTRLSFGAAGYELELHFYDTRHWDCVTNNYNSTQDLQNTKKLDKNLA